jgi:hypothetical protein
MAIIAGLDPATYRRHAIHGDNRRWAQTNCYTDVLIELLHSLGQEPIAALPFTLAIDFEVDQWTFFKVPHEDLYLLYGYEVQELAVWKPLAAQVAEQVAAARPVLVELDSWLLPDTAGTAYRLAHVKSTVAVNWIDLDKQAMGYFHNEGYHEVAGADFRDLFQIDGLVHERMLPPYFEVLKRHRHLAAHKGPALVAVSLALMKKHLERAPRSNPFTRFKKRFAEDLEWLAKAELADFHAYSFATLRQYGACYELSETYLRWLSAHGVTGLEEAVETFAKIAQAAKTFQFQLARAMARSKPLDLSPLDAMAANWESGIGLLQGQRVYA